MNILKRFRFSMICASTILLAAAPMSAWAEESPSKSVSVKLKLGEDSISINDQSIKIETPYVSNGTTLVPLRVITSAFGAVLNWNSETQTVGLKYGTISIALQIGSTSATVNGQTETLETAPELKNGTTMVPLRFLSEKFGANVVYDEATSSISITGNSVSTASDSGGIDSDFGKSRIGNSYYGWSMKYPSGLVKNYQNFQEDFVSFTDANGEYKISVDVRVDQSENLSKDELISILTEDLDNETVLEKNFVTDGPFPYAHLVTKSNGKLYESRAYQNGDKVFIIFFTINKEENYKAPAKYSVYEDLMNSFQMSYDKNDTTIKDLSAVKDGIRTYKDETYGISLNLPADWTKSPNNTNEIRFFSPKKTNYMIIRITSLKDGDTLDSWVNRARSTMTDMFVAEYLKMDPTKNMTIDGNPAIEWRNYNTFDQKRWDATENVYTIKGNYKYMLAYEFTKKDDLSESLIQNTLNSIKISKPSDSIGTLQDPNDELDRTRTSVFKNKDYSYSIKIPSYWKTDTSRGSTSANVRYLLPFGYFGITSMENNDSTPQQVVERVKTTFQNNLKDVPVKEVENRKETIAGSNAVWVVWEVKDTITTVCAFEKSGTSYLIVATNAKAGNTEAFKKRLQETIKSFQSTN